MDRLIQFCEFLTPPFARAWLKKQLIDLKLYEERVKELKDGVKNLKKARVVVEHRVDEEEKRYGREITNEVKEWIEEVKEIISEYEAFDEDEELHELAVFDFFESGKLPKPGIRRSLSKKANDFRKEVDGLLQKAKHDTFSYWVDTPSMAAFFSNVDYISFPSRDETKKKIMAEMEKPNVRMIGFHGLSGVGKTTLVKQVAEEVIEGTNKIFDQVIMANVTRNVDIRKIQGQLADMLGMKLDEESDIARAARIQKRLKNEKKSMLVILDDLWAKLDLNMVGIPSEDDGSGGLKNVKEEKSSVALSEGKTELDAFKMVKSKNLPANSNMMEKEETPNRFKGCKVLLISETKKVLLSQMEGKGDRIFSLEVLNEEEAKTLFKKKAAIGDANAKLAKLAAEIANKCEGLPMSLIATAVALRNQRPSVWEEVNRNLEQQKFTGAPEFSTKLSYDLLENEELKYTFLLCARMGHDALVMDLVKYCIGLGFLQRIYTVREARDRVHALVGKLKESSLLSDSNSKDHFTMQNIVRSAALSIASEEMHVFTLTKEKIDEWPDEDKLERYTAISLHHCYIIEGFPRSINCPRLRVFHVNNNDPHLEIPDNFFEGMKELKVLILTGFNLSPLPWSIARLTKLRMLCLEQCILGEELSIISELKKLRILSLSGSNIAILPSELKQLTKLQIFYISNCFKLRKIPSNVIKSLINLEELYMRNTLIEWEDEEQTNQSENASLSELRHLNQLTTVDIQISNVSHLPKNLFFDKLYSYKIVIGDLKAYLETDFKMPEKYETSRFLAVHLKNGFDIHSQKGIKLLFKRVEILLLEDLNGVQDSFYRLSLKGFPYLKHLSIISNSDIESLIKPKDRQCSEKAFPKLESLYLYNLKNMNKICSCKLSTPSFGKLKVIKINLCGQLKNVFLISVVRLLTDLETIEVSECNSMKEIVAVETQCGTDEIECLEFCELRSLTLQALPQFIRFYPNSSKEGETTGLFHEKIVFSKLERIELSSIQIGIIWNDQPSLSSYFRSLIHLDVNGCWNLEFLLSFSMAKSLVNLQSLFASECDKMSCIFPPGQGSLPKMEDNTEPEQDCIFPNLKNMKLSSMKSLSEIWNSELPSDSFGKLDTLILEQCDKLVNVFPSNVEGKIFQSICNLTVTKCMSMEAVFDLGDKNRDAVDVTKLQDIHLEALPMLKHVWKWNKDQEGFLNLNNLQKIWVYACNSLENIFPVCMAKSLSNLEHLVLRNCLELREIAAKGEGTNTDKSIPNPTIIFEFPKLSTIKLVNLPKLESFYPVVCELRCSALNDLSIERCDKLEPFRKGTADEQIKSALFSEEVINKLKSMQIESWHAKSSSSYMGEGNYRRDNLEDLHLSRLSDTEILYSFLHRNPNLERLSLNNCFFKEIVPLINPSEIESMGVVPELKSLKLTVLPKLENIGFERDIILQRIEVLILEKCHCLVTIVPFSSISLTHLTILEVVNCDGLKSLMPPSTAKTLIQLSTMKVINCKSLKEIVLEEQGNEEENRGKVDIVFKQLKVLELVSLNSLQSFCSSKTYDFKFPLLENLVVSACPEMKKFSESNKTPILQKIYVVHEKEKKRWYWDGNLNDTIQNLFKEKKYFEGMDEMSHSEYLELQQACHDGVGLQKNWFYSLTTLKLVNCELQRYAIPSHLLPYLNSLKELEVRSCNKVEVIFEMNDTERAFQLKKLNLEGLLELTHIWENNCPGILSFQNLQQVQEIVVEEAAAARTREEFVFPRLTKLLIYDLTQLTYFYPGTFALECPALNHLYILNCKLELFQSAHPEGEGEGSRNRNTGFLNPRAISNMKELWLDWKHASELRSRLGQFPEDLNYLNELSLFFDADENEEPTFPFEILQKAPNLESLIIYSCSRPEIFVTQNPGYDEDGMLGHLKTLFVLKMYEMESIASDESSWLNTVCDKLRKLNIIDCPDLTTLVHSAVSFSCLKELFISECPGLKHLFTSSAAEKLKHLETITVKECGSMKQIVATSEIVHHDETTSEGIKFERLERITLDELSSMEFFYSGNDTLQLPSLIQVSIWQCPKMEIFSQALTHGESFRGIQASSNSNDELVFQGDLNASMKRVFLQQDHLVLGDSPMLQEIWCTLDPVPDWCFCNLNSLVVEGCDFLSNAILPSHLLPFLSNLKELQVRNCNSVKTIFDDMINMGPASDPLSIGLKKLILEQLPSLKHIWKNDPQGSLCLPFLEEVLVYGCESIKSLFPALVAKDRLQKLDVKNCDGIVEIFAKDEATTEEANKELIIFPNITFLGLWNLPNLTCIYPGMHILEWPMLKELKISQCQMLKFFATEFQNSPDSHPGGEDSSPTDGQAFVSLEKVTPHLEVLWLRKEEAMIIEQGKLCVDLQGLHSLYLHFINK